MTARRAPAGMRAKDRLGAARGLKAVPDDVDALVGGLGLDWEAEPDLDPVALAMWRELAARYADEPTRLRENSREFVVAYCQNWALRRAALAALLADGVLVPGRSEHDEQRKVKNPAWQLYREATLLLVRIGRELGFGEDAAGKLGMRTEPPDPYSPFA